jgi:hypothetical protein
MYTKASSLAGDSLICEATKDATATNFPRGRKTRRMRGFPVGTASCGPRAAAAASIRRAQSAAFSRGRAFLLPFIFFFAARGKSKVWRQAVISLYEMRRQNETEIFRKLLENRATLKLNKPVVQCALFHWSGEQACN